MNSGSGYYDLQQALAHGREAVRRSRLTSSPEDLAASLKVLAEAAFLAENYDLAISSVRKARGLDPHDAELARRLATYLRAAIKRAGEGAKPPKGSPQSETSSD